MIAGILLSEHLQYKQTHDNLIIICGLLTALSYCLVILAKSNPNAQSLALLLGIFTIGFSLHSINHQLNWPQHFSNEHDKFTSFKGRICSYPGNKKNLSFTIRIQAIKTGSNNWSHKTGYIKINLKKDKNTPLLNQSDEIIFTAKAYPIDAPSNPLVFDYKRFLARKNIFHQCFISSKDIIGINSNTFSLKKTAMRVRAMMNARINKMIKSDNSKAIIKAMLLGDKSHLSETTKRQFTETGAMHVLAVSGLHVGIIYMLSLYLFKLLGLKQYKRLQILVIIIILWAYAFLTGLSPSVVRASLMLSLFLIGQLLFKQTNLLNVLFATAFFMLLSNPNYVFQIGFQFSFLALLGIVLYTEKFAKLWTSKNFLIQRMIQLISVSIAAQIFILPFAVSYFHQQHSYFLLSAVFIIPAAFLIMILSIASLFLDLIFEPLSHITVWMLQYLLEIVSYLQTWIQNLPFHLIDNIWWQSIDFISYAWVLIIISKSNFPNTRSIVYLCIILFLNSTFKITQNYRPDQKHHFIAYDLKHSFAYDFIIGSRCYSFVNPKRSKNIDFINKNIRSKYKVEEIYSLDINAIKNEVSYKQYQSYIQINGSSFFFLNTQTKYFPSKCSKIDVLMVSHNSIFKFEKLIKRITPKLVILDNSNSRVNIAKMKEILDIKNIRTHIINSKGFFIYEIKD